MAYPLGEMYLQPVHWRVQQEWQSYISLTDSGGSIDFDNENLTTTSTITAEQLTTTDDLTVTDEASIDGLTLPRYNRYRYYKF